MLSVATWNINSVRLRIETVARFVAEHRPDVLCLQETKCMDGQFPLADVRRMGFEHIAIHGQKGYHGVAIFSRHALADVDRRAFCGKNDARHIAVTLAEGPGAGTRIHNFYVPAGGDEPDRTINPKFGQKLDFLERMTRWAERVDRPTLIVGDFNIAPLASDVWNHKQLLKVVSHTPIEVETLQRFKDAHGWTDIGREFVPDPQRYYSWWSYRAADWKANDRGRRLDHMWASPQLASQASSHRLREDARDWDKPSDHVPLITEFNL
mgnify:CR=1 FL=1